MERWADFDTRDIVRVAIANRTKNWNGVVAIEAKNNAGLIGIKSFHGTTINLHGGGGSQKKTKANVGLFLNPV